MPRPLGRDLGSVPVTKVATRSQLRSLTDRVASADAVAIDTETHDALLTRDGTYAAVRVISVGLRHGSDHTAYAVDVRDLDVADVAAMLAAVDCAWGWNVNFDDLVLRWYGARVGRWRDAMLDESLLWAGADGRGWYLSLDVATSRYVGGTLAGKDGTRLSYDAQSDLTDEQLRYAGHDALATLWVGEHVAELLDGAGLSVASELEQGARPFIAMMMEHGFAFDLGVWQPVLDSQQARLTAALCAIAAATDGGVPTEPGQPKVPSFNPDSDAELRDALNRYAADHVMARFGRLLEPSDKLDKATMGELKQLGCDLAGHVLDYRAAAKYLTTYGDNIAKFVESGRIHSRYKQCLTATGRLASDRPNAQNWPGEAKKAMRPGGDRVMLLADYSQAELRALAHIAQDRRMLDAFGSGADLHELTASEMFHINIAELKKTDPEAADKARTKVKRVNFGIPYGLGAAQLGRGLTLEGVPTSTDEAQQLIDGVLSLNVEMAAWLKQRDDFVRDLAANPGPVDWAASIRLLELWAEFEGPRKAFKRRHKRYPSPAELLDAVRPPTEQLDLFSAVLSTEENDAERARLAEELDWAFRYDAPVVLRPNGDPLAWESRTVSGRRRVFMVTMDSGYRRSESEDGRSATAGDRFDGVLTSAMLLLATTDKAAAAKIRDEWAAANKVPLPTGVNRCQRRDGEDAQSFRARQRVFGNEERTKAVKAFEGNRKPLKLAFVRHMCDRLGPEATELLFSRALADQIRKRGNAFRNHPIQGTVADIVERAFAGLFGLCADYPELVWTMSVHDSIFGEAPLAQAEEIALRQLDIMEAALVEFCPSVPAKVDVCVAWSASEKDDKITAVRRPVPVAA
jgi:DNA polymerase-1